MASTRRTFLKTAGMAGAAALAARLGRPSAAAGEPPQAAGATPRAASTPPRGLTLCNFQRSGALSLGVRTKSGILDVAAAAKARRLKAPLTTDDVVRGRSLAGLQQVLADVQKSEKFVLPEKGVSFGPCVSSPEKIVMLGYNYRKHCAEMKIPIPTAPVLFNKYNNALLGHGGCIPLPTRVSSQFDHEVELVVVMGRSARDVSGADALSHVFGYCTGNDFSARDLQFKTSQVMLGKSCDGFAPLGPWLVSADHVKDPQKLKLECRVNGEVRQSSSTEDMIFSCAEIVSYVSQHMTLRPGDIIFTGTPEGVILGKPEAERVWLKAGDRISTEVEGLGELRFTLG